MLQETSHIAILKMTLLHGSLRALTASWQATSPRSTSEVDRDAGHLAAWRFNRHRLSSAACIDSQDCREGLTFSPCLNPIADGTPRDRATDAARRLVPRPRNCSIIVGTVSYTHLTLPTSD